MTGPAAIEATVEARNPSTVAPRLLHTVRPAQRRPAVPKMVDPESVRVDNRLIRSFRILAFDWDGTAVSSRSEDAGEARWLLERLLHHGIDVVVITGTNFDNIDRQLSSEIRGPHKRHLYIATNRGSEVYGFDEASRPELVWQRRASPEEERRLTEIAEAVRASMASAGGLEVDIVYNRLNRRKIDLIPLPEWSDPPKSAIGELLKAVEARLQGAGFAGGFSEVFARTERTALEKGLPDARITSDVKHIEVGLTDKSDAIAWVMRALARPNGVRPEDVLIAGDEFGPIAGVPGSDAKMLTPEADGATVVSVGVEPGGVPPGVIHLGGGPSRFRQLLAQLPALHETPSGAGGAAPLELPARPTARRDWHLVEDGFIPAREHEIESLFAVSNGYVGTRGSLAEGGPFSRPATFLAGVFDREPTPEAMPSLVVLPDWTRLQVLVDGRALSLEAGEPLEHRRVLDLRQGMLVREWRHLDPAGRITRLRFLRLVSLADRHVLLQSVLVVPENYSGRVELLSGGDVPEGLEPQVPDGIPAGTVSLRTDHRGVTIAMAAAGWLETETGERIAPRPSEGGSPLAACWEWAAAIGGSARLDRLVAVYTSREVERPAETAAQHLARVLGDGGADRVVADHVRAWASRWRAADVRVGDARRDQLTLRFAAYHLIGAANPEDDRASIGARALTGDGYQGHVFWDTEIYILPFYVFTWPEAARALLMYRYHTLPAAREKARAAGYRGALYAWESTDTGEEAAPPLGVSPDGEIAPILTGEQEHHVSADIAYAVWHYWRATQDDAFFLHAGAEIVLETARFWASRGQLGPDGRYHIRRVMGPDEYHASVDDNAFTNGMAQWNLERGAETARLLGERWPDAWRELAGRLRLSELETAEWQRLAQLMYTGFDPATGLIEQFQGYFGLEDLDLAAYASRRAPMEWLLGHERLQRARIIKQADVILLLYLLWERFSPEIRAANFRYYDPRTAHGSSLSPAIHALVAARLGDTATAERYFRQAAEVDLDSNMGNASSGVHIATQGGIWQSAVFGFAGLQSDEDGLTFDPHLPSGWRRLTFPLRWRDRRALARIHREPASVDLRLEGGEPTKVRVAAGPETTIAPGGTGHIIRRHDGGWGEWQAGGG